MAADTRVFAFLTRRKMLKLGLAGAGALAVGGLGLRAVLGPAPRIADLQVLSAYGYRTLDTLAKTLFPIGGAFELGAGQFDLAREYDGYLAGEPAPNIEKLERALTLFELGPVLFERRLQSFSQLPEAERLAHYQAWATSDELLRRQVALAFRKFLALTFYDKPEVWPDIGYGGPSLARLGK